MKIILKDKTEIVIVNASTDSFQCEVTVSEMADTFDKLTPQNLSKFEIQNEDGNTMTIEANKAVASCDYSEGVATFHLKDVNDTDARITALEEAVDTLLVNDLLGGE